MIAEIRKGGRFISLKPESSMDIFQLGKMAHSIDNSVHIADGELVKMEFIISDLVAALSSRRSIPNP